MRRLLIMWFAMAVACVAWPATARAEGPEPSLELEIDVSALPRDDETEGLRFLLVEAQTRILRDGGIAVVEDGSASARLRVVVSRYGEGDLNYRFTVMLLEGEAMAVERTLTCDLCRDTELITKVSEEVARVSGRFAYEREEAARVEGSASEGEPTGAEEGNPAEKVRRVGGAGWAGIGLAAAGIGLGIGGAVELARPSTWDLRPDDNRYEVSVRPRALGAALLGVGGSLLVTGVVLLAVDQTVLLERRMRRVRRMALVPSFSSTGVGVSWSGRF